ncbi:MAG: protein kinase, partial [Gemmatimonadaceae bacterium]
MQPHNDDLSVPPVLGDRFELLREIGRGGAAVVFVARDRTNDQLVAVKVLKHELAQVLGVGRFNREIEIASTLHHKSIVSILSFGDTNLRCWYAMPFVAGGTLRDRLKAVPQLKIADATDIARQIAAALAHAHQHGFVHRDVKPENILLSEADALLSDFGIARSMDLSVASHLTSTGVALGTPAYMSPEQASGSSVLDGSSDVYSLGCVLYEMLAGMPPFVGPTAQVIIAQRFTHPPRPLSAYRQNVPEHLERLVERCLILTPADRPSVEEFIACLDSPGDATGKRGKKISVRLSRRIWLASLLSLLLVVFVAAWWMHSRRLDPTKVILFSLQSPTPEIVEVLSPLPSLIIEALAEVAPIHWDEGDELVRNAIGDQANITRADRRTAARRVHAGYFVEGSVLTTVDSTIVVVRLIATRSDSVVSLQRKSSARNGEAVSTLAVQAFSSVLPALLDPGRKADVDAITKRNPAAVATFILAEKEYRQSKYAPALRLYERSLELDSNLVIAALKGARSARSLFDEVKARTLIQLAVARDSMLHGPNVDFAKGLFWLYQFRSDSALKFLKQAIAIQSQSAELHTAAGDVFYYLGVDGVDSDSAAESYYRTAHLLDPAFTPAMYYLMWISSRQRRSDATRKLANEYAALGSADSTVVRALRIASSCQSGEVGSIR